MTNFTRPYFYGQQPIRRQNPQQGQSEWYYLDPRTNNSFSEMRTIDVPNKDSPNPYAAELQQYWYQNDPNSYKDFYGDTQPQKTENNNSFTGEVRDNVNNRSNAFASARLGSINPTGQGTPYWPNSLTGNYLSTPSFGMENNGTAITTQPLMKENKRTVYRSLSGFKPNQQQWYENNPQKDNINFVEDEYETNPLVNDCLKSPRFRDFMDYLYQSGVEGEGYENDPKKIDQPTFSGLSEGLYKNALIKYPELKKNYPSNLSQTTKSQRENIMCQTTYKPQHVETINNDRFAKTYWDLMVNHKQYETAVPMIQKALNSIDDVNINVDGVSGSSTISAINNLNQEQLKQLNNTINEYRENFINTEVRPMFRKGLSTRNKNLKW